MTYKKLTKKLQKLIKKEGKIKNMEIDLDESILSLSEKIVMESEKCNLKEAYEKGIVSPKLHLPGGVSITIVDKFCNIDDVKNDITIKELFDKCI